ncbi:rRNA-processing protein FCF1-like isoform X1 [Quercus lobata]|uniref:rRNA-processing protein FCF1-like isoform X1 n=1 Tax=Quercus lobata TaxID=97700 RepID=UPI0012442E4F|nr:rRNA-processing protein FCF1-like isoform X1 [Quercus lobata]
MSSYPPSKVEAANRHHDLAVLFTEFSLRVPKVSLALFFNYNTLMGPAYRVLVDTNFIDFCIPNKLDLEKGMMDCLYAKCEFRITGFFNLM